MLSAAQVLCRTPYSWREARSEESMLEVWMKSHKSHEVAITKLLFTPTRKQCRLSAIIGGSCHKCQFCRDKHWRLLSWQKYPNREIFLSRQNFVARVCRDKTFVATSILLLQQKTCFVSHDKHVFVVVTKVRLFCRDKIMFVATKYFCRTWLSWRNFGRNKHTCAATKDVFCRNKHVFVATKVILVATVPPMILPC